MHFATFGEMLLGSTYLSGLCLPDSPFRRNPVFFRLLLFFMVLFRSSSYLLLFAAFLVWTVACKRAMEKETVRDGEKPVKIRAMEPPLAKIPLAQDINIAGFFPFLDQMLQRYDSICPYALNEYLLLRANARVLDTLVSTDYYLRLQKGEWVYDQTRLTVLHAGDTLLLPGVESVAVLLEKMNKTWIDINIPAFQLRIMEGDSVIFHMPVRIGKNQHKFLEMAGHSVDLRTRTGTGTIIRVNRKPVFYDPVTGEQFYYTKRDDHKTTLMPQIPWLEPAIGGRRLGQMIHPTTNPRTLGKAASNGCIGISEADAWRVYAYAPVGTRVVIRYDLEEFDPHTGDTLHYPDVYQLRSNRKIRTNATLTAWGGVGPEVLCQCDSLF